MKIIEAINRIDSLKPNQYDVKTKITWLSYLDGEIRRTVIDTHEGRPTTAFSNYTENDMDKELVVPAPFDEMYVTYLGMKIDEANCEATRYNNSAMMFNTQMQNFRIDYNRTHMPIQQGFRREVPLSPPPVPSIPIAGESFGMIKVDPQDEYLSMDNGGYLRVDAEKIKEETLADLPEGGESVDAYTKAETDALLEDKADKALVYTKTEVDSALSSKVNASTVYIKTEVDTALNAKADKSTTYTKQEVDTALVSKATANNVYTKHETDELIPEVPVKSISLNGTPVSPDAQGNVALNVSGGDGQDYGGSVSGDTLYIVSVHNGEEAEF